MPSPEFQHPVTDGDDELDLSSLADERATSCLFSGVRPTAEETDPELTPSAQALGVDAAVAAISSIFFNVTAVRDKVVVSGKTFLRVEVRVIHDGSVVVSLLPYPAEITYWRLECVKSTLDEALSFVTDCCHALRSEPLAYSRLFEVEAKHKCVSRSAIRESAYVKAVHLGQISRTSLLGRLRRRLLPML